MPRDYKNTQRQTEALKSAPRWPYFFSGLFLGLGVAVGVFFFEEDLSGTMAHRPVVAPLAFVEPVTEPVPAADPPKATFDFYRLLPEMEVAVKEVGFAAAVPVVERAAASEVAATTVDGPFVIQVASFRQMTDADSVKASLALLGLEGHIQTVSIGGQTWHRVRLGPYSELNGLNDARTRLYENNFDAQVYY